VYEQIKLKSGTKVKDKSKIQYA